MGKFLDAIQVPREVVVDGKTFRLSPLTLELRAQYELWMERRAIEAVRRQKRFESDEEYHQSLGAVHRDIASGVYTFGTPVWLNFVKSMSGQKYLIYLMLRLCQKDQPEQITEDLVEKYFEEFASALVPKEEEVPNPNPPPNQEGVPMVKTST